MDIFCHSNKLFAVCEPNRAMELAAMPGSPFQVVKQQEVLSGYQAAVVREWVLDTTRCVSPVHTLHPLPFVLLSGCSTLFLYPVLIPRPSCKLLS